jgi:hypothetical protein
MGVLSAVTGILSGNTLTGVSKVIDSIRGKSPETAAQLETIVENNKAAFQLAELEVKKETIKSYDSEVVQAAGIITAEAKSQSWIARNARPLLLLTFGFSISFVAIYNCVANSFVTHFVPFVLPDWMYKLTAIGFTGYVGARTWEKLKGADL